MPNHETHQNHFSTIQQAAFALLRIGIGWHFLREGWVKLAHPTWSAAGYLYGSWGPFAGLFHWIGTLTVGDTPILNHFCSTELQSSPWLLNLSNVAIPWLLILSGIGLMLGLCTRVSIVIAVSLLAMFYAATPPFDFAPASLATNWPGFQSNMQHAEWAGNHLPQSEGNYLLVNKNLIEMLALICLFVVQAGNFFALDLLFKGQQQFRDWFSSENRQTREILNNKTSG